ncbi:hypothetical protein [Labilibacter marinus]|uniref:hypothetical protein n=1 Tax=Labilibacter marinus TaxID=1477105 RepID=UPI000829B308|nr:hypothetical protein [Labilibacter marinus]
MNKGCNNSFEVLDNLFSQYELEDSEFLYLELEELKDAQYEILILPQKINVKRLKRIYDKMDLWALQFPYVFISSKYEVSDTISIGNKISLAYYNLNLKVSASGNKLTLNSYSYSKISLCISLLIHKKEELHVIKRSKAANSLSNKIGDSYSQGELIDHIDQVYDQYKHTNININNFRTIFRSFGCHTEDIGNRAFDLFMESRSTSESWKNAIEEFLTNKVDLSQMLAEHISNILTK